MQNNKIDKLISYCQQSQQELKAMLDKELQEQGRQTINKDGFLYSMGTHPVLLVSHLDTVHNKLPTDIYVDRSDPDSPDGDLRCRNDVGVGGDDRAGIFIVMEMIKHFDCHVLFCEDEEQHGIGAGKFTESNIYPDVQFIVEFDRRGRDDAVFYGCNNTEFTVFVTSFGFQEQVGSFSDISLVAPHLGIAAVNLSSGYYEAHSEREFVRLGDVDSIIERAVPLISDVSTRYEYPKSHNA